MGRKAKKPEIVAYSSSDVLKKSNFFINSKFKQSITEIQITHLAMMKIQDGDYVRAEDGLYVSMKAAEIRKFLKKSSGSFYDKLAKVANSMAGTTMGIMDKENESFHFLTMVNRADYEDGVFTIRYPKELTDYLVNIQSNFTPITREIVANMTSPYTYKLYEMLRRQCFYPTGYTGERNNRFQFRVSLSELKLSIGLVDSSEKNVKRVLDNSRATKEDYDRAVNNSKESNYKVYTDFNRHVLKPAVEEINEKTDIRVEYDEIRAGYGGKVEWIEFTVQLFDKLHKKAEPEIIIEPADQDMGSADTEKKEPTQAEKFMFWTYVMQKFSEEKLSPEDAIAISEEASYSTEKIDNAYSVLQSSHSEIDNVVGWIRTAIKEDWKAAESSKKRSDKKGMERQKDLDAWLSRQVKEKLD